MKRVYRGRGTRMVGGCRRKSCKTRRRRSMRGGSKKRDIRNLDKVRGGIKFLLNSAAANSTTPENKARFGAAAKVLSKSSEKRRSGVSYGVSEGMRRGGV